MRKSVYSKSRTIALLASFLGAAVIGRPLIGQVQTGFAARLDVQNPLGLTAKLLVDEVPLSAALTTLAENSGVTLVYSPSRLPTYLVTCECYALPVGEALNRLLLDGQMQYSVHGQNVVVEPRQLPILLNGGPPARLASRAGGLRTLPSGPAGAPLGSQGNLPTAFSQGERVGTVTGMVTDSRTAQPLASAQVMIPELGIGSLTTQNGRYVLLNVPAGSHTIAVQRIGYRAATSGVTVADDASVNQDFTLEEEALALDEIIVTGTPGGTQRRAIGNAVGRVNAAEITQVAPVSSMQELIGAREPGLNFVRGSGNVGTGSTIRIRGLSSLSMSSQPLIFVDGIRVDNTADAGPDLRDAPQVSTLDDLSPNEIESIEVIKGPAAATLYGTEASAGVIQIITKRGESGAPQFDVGVTLGTNWLANVNHWVGTAYDRNNPETPGLRLYEKEKSEGREWLQYGPLQTYTGSMRGGSDAIRYFLSAEYQDNEGIVDYNWQKQVNLRGNVTVLPTDKLTLDVNMGYLEGLTSFMQQKNPFGLWDGLMWANAAGVDTRIRGFQRARPEMIAQIEATRDVSRFTGSTTLTHRPTDWLTSRFVVGIDRMDEFNSNLVPRFPEGADTEFGSLGLGDLQISSPVRQNLTADWGSSADFDVTPSIGLTTSVGFQFYERSEHITAAHGQIFPAPQIRTIGGATQKSADQTFVENKSVGAYLQQEVAWNERVFLTAALRGDDNSAFGAEFDAAIYPKFSATWVLSEEPFYSIGNIANSLRLRSAWGMAGRQPDTFAAVTLFRGAVGPAGAPAISTDVLGNADLGPEVSAELEVGFDAALFDDRASVEFTYYTQKVRDALLPRPVNPVSGFSGSQSVNAGQLSNWGWELATNVRVIDSNRFDWDLGSTLSMNDNRADDLGVLLPTNDLREGRPFPFFTERHVVEVGYTTADGGTGIWPHDIPDPEARVENVTYALCDGGAGFDGYSTGGAPVPCAEAPQLAVGNGRVTPRYEGSLNSTFTIGENLRLFAMAEWRGEHWATSLGLLCRYLCGSGRELNTFRPAKWAEALVAVDNVASNTIGYDTPNTAFATLREVSANYTLPTSLVNRFGAQRGSINIATRNPWIIWQANKFVYNVPVEPEGRDGAGYGAGGDPLAQNRLALPTLTSFVITTRVTF
ncbi:MAG: SusC/RagA family TonB-linked outer membrane protein [Gemmatimonas sp.]|nr:SusC/RagA family TonB-linked outer membrane protein [Gemmatimonas sp.]